jgi:hypothetical protein
MFLLYTNFETFKYLDPNPGLPASEEAEPETETQLNGMTRYQN